MYHMRILIPSANELTLLKNGRCFFRDLDNQTRLISHKTDWIIFDFHLRKTLGSFLTFIPTLEKSLARKKL